MKLPVLISVPHAGLDIPPEVESLSLLSERQIAEDGDEGAGEIYAIESNVQAYVTTDIARAFIDMNRSADDMSRDGVIKTHTCWDVPIYAESLSGEIVDVLLDKYYHPYHSRIDGLCSETALAMDCHTMAANGPPIGPGAGASRPFVCLSNAEYTCPDELLLSFARLCEDAFQVNVSINDPFKGGYIVRSHSGKIPWIQVEISRAPFMTNQDKRLAFLKALNTFVSGRL